MVYTQYGFRIEEWFGVFQLVIFLSHVFIIRSSSGTGFIECCMIKIRDFAKE